MDAPKHRTVWSYLVWLLPVAILFLSGALFMRGIDIQKKVIQETQMPLTAPTATPTPDPTAGWKSYTSSALGFGFKYPPDYTVAERAPGFFVISAPGEHVAQGGISIEARLKGPYAGYETAKTSITTGYAVTDTKKLGVWEIFQGTGTDGMLKGVGYRFGIAPYKTGAIEAETLTNSQYVTVFDSLLSTFSFASESGAL